jgi:hypothetical protein
MEFAVSQGGDLQSASEGYQLAKCPQLNGYLLEGRRTSSALSGPTGGSPGHSFRRREGSRTKDFLYLGISEDLSLPLDELSRRNRENRLPGKGSYAIVDDTLLLNYDDGRRRQLLIYVFSDDARKDSPDLIVVAGMAFSRAQ